jgi:hypothetical protein
MPSTADTIEVLDKGHPIAYSFEDLLKYHGPGSPGGVANGFKVMERGFALLEPEGPLERREVTLATSFGGPGARDAFEMVTRAVTGDRFTHDPSLARPELGRERERFVFQLGYRERTVTLVIRDGYVVPEFLDLARKDGLSPDEKARFVVLKQELADRVMGADAADVFDAE